MSCSQDHNAIAAQHAGWIVRRTDKLGGFPCAPSQALHSSAEAAVQQLSSQLRELQQGGGSGQAAAAAAAAAEVQLQLQLDQARREAALLQDTITAYETVSAWPQVF